MNNTTVTLLMMKNYFKQNDDGDKNFYRTSNTNFGLPNQNKEYSNGNVKYNILLKTWNCAICGYSKNTFLTKMKGDVTFSSVLHSAFI